MSEALLDLADFPGIRHIWDDGLRRRFRQRFERNPNLLYNYLCDDHEAMQPFRHRLEATITCATSHSLLSDQLVGRLRSPKDGFRQAFAEIEVAHFLITRGFELTAEPAGRLHTIGDYEIATAPPIFLEVKAVMEGRAAEREHRISRKIWDGVREVTAHRLGGRTIELYVDRYADDFRLRHFKKWLERKLKSTVADTTAQLIYEDVDGLRLAVTVHARHGDADNPVGLMEVSQWSIVVHDSRLAAATRGSLRQLPRDNRPTLVVLRPRSASIKPDDLLTALFGQPEARWNADTEEIVATRTFDGVFQIDVRRRLSAVGILTGGNDPEAMQESLHVVHNPWARLPLKMESLCARDIRHFVSADDDSMAWKECA